jgi:hypothetical protein
MEDEKKSFWRRWLEADETERMKMVRTLPCFSRGGICRYMTATLFNSYLRDLYDEVKKK